MIHKSYSLSRIMGGCCGCFRFSNPKRRPWRIGRNYNLSQELLLDEEEEEEEIEDEDNQEFNGEITENGYGEITEINENGYGEDYGGECPDRVKPSEEILKYREENGMICRQFPVKETHKVVRSEDENGNKMVNEYVRESKIGAGSYGKVCLYRSSIDGKHYAIKAFHKSHLLKQRVAPSETAMTDVLREVRIMKLLEHPNIVNLFEVIDDPNTDHFYMVLEYVDGKLACEDSGPPGGIGEATARKYLRDIVSGLIYLHAHDIVHGDIKPDNLLVTYNGTVKIGDFSVSQVFEDDNDDLRRSPGTPVFTAPECCLGLNYGGRAADTWAVGVTLYSMIVGKYPFLGETLQDTYEKIVNDPLVLPDGLNSELLYLLEGLLCKDPNQRLTLDAVAKHAWVIREDDPIPQYLCWCQRSKLSSEQCNGRTNSTHKTLNEPDESQSDTNLLHTD